MIVQANNHTLKYLVVGDIETAYNFHDSLLRKNLAVIILSPTSDLDATQQYDVISIFLEDDLASKSSCLAGFRRLFPDALLTTAIDGIDLATLQEASGTDVLGLNLSYPVESSLFMEVIRTDKNTEDAVQTLLSIGKTSWGLDPYISHNISARNYMLAAMTREAFHLVDNGYATAESVDRACRNDAGYYMPFTGNFLYMDLMGTVAYALVMRDLNPELAKSKSLPTWFEQLPKEGKGGMQLGAGVYAYKEGDYVGWRQLMDEFSVDIVKLINKYRKNYE